MTTFDHDKVPAWPRIPDGMDAAAIAGFTPKVPE